MKWFGKKDIVSKSTGGKGWSNPNIDFSNLTTWPGGGLAYRGRKMHSDYIKAPKTKKKPFFTILFPTDKPESRERRVRNNRRF